MSAVERIYRETEQWNDLIDILLRKLHGGRLEPSDEKSLRFEIGAVWRDKLQETEAAMAVYREMMERFPDDVRIYDELANLHLQAEAWEELSAVLSRKLRALADRSDAEPKQLADLHCKLGMLEYGRAGDIGAAVEHYSDAIATDPNCDLAVQSLEELLASDSHRDEIARSLEPVYVRRGAHSELADVLEIQLAKAKKRQRTKLLKRLISLYRDRCDDSARALFAASRLFEMQPADTGLQETIEALSAELGEYAHLADLYELHVEEVEDPEIQLHLNFTVARAAHEHLADYERAERHYLAVLELEPSHKDTLDHIEVLYLESDQPEKLLGILRTKETLAEKDEARIDFRFQTAAILADRLNRIDDAIEDMREVLGLSARHPDALERLDVLFQRAEHWEDLHDILIIRVEEAATDAVKTSLLFRLGLLREEQLDDVQSAIETYADILVLDQVHSDCVAALERLFGEEEHAPTIAPLLETTYRQLDDWEGLILVYTVMEATSDSTSERVELHYRMAKLNEEKGQSLEGAFSSYGDAYRLEPEGEETMRQLLRLGESIGAQAALAELLLERVEDIDDGERRREVHRVIAGLFTSLDGMSAQAVQQYRAVLDIQPDDLAAVDALIAIHRKETEWGDLVEMLAQKASLLEQVDQRKDLLLEAGAIAAQQMGDPQVAIRVYEQVLDLDASEMLALDALALRYEETEAWDDLVRIIERKIGLVEDLDERKVLAQEVASVQEFQLEDLDAAIDTHRQVLTWDPDDLGELAALEELLTKSERWSEILDVLDRQVALVEQEARKELQLRKSTILKDQLNDTVAAIRMLEVVLDDDPTEESAQNALEVIVQTSDEREAAFEVLQPNLAMSEQWSRIYSLLDVLVAERDDAFARIQGLHEMGTIAEEQLADPERAFACFGRAVQQDLEHVASMEAVERLASEHALWEQLVGLLLNGASSTDDPMGSTRLLLRASEVLKSELGDMDRAIATYRNVLEDESDNVVALESLDELYQITERWSDLATILQTRVETSGETEQRVMLFFRLADVSENRLSNADHAFECYREIYYLQPGNEDAIEQLERLMQAGVHRADIAALLEPVYLEAEQWEQLHSLLILRLELEDDPIDILELRRRLGELNLNRLDRKADAQHWFGEAFRLDPADDMLLTQLEQLASDTGEFGHLNDVLLDVAISLDESDRKVAIWHRAAKIVEDKLNDPQQAETIYELILDEESDDLVALKNLARMYLAQERWSDLEGVLERQIELVEYDDERIALLLRLGELLRDHLQRLDDSIGAYNRALDLNDMHPLALASVADLYRDTEQWESLSGVLRRRVDSAESDDERLDHLREMALVAEQMLQDTEQAIELWEEVLQVAFTDLDAVRNVQRLQRGEGNHEAVADALEREQRILDTSDPVRSVEIYREAGQLWSGPIEDNLQAQEAWTKLLAIAENDVQAMRSLAAIYEDEANWDALSQNLERMVASDQFDGDELRGLYERLAMLYTDDLPDPERAISSWERVRELDPEALAPVEALELLFTDEGHWEKQVAILDVKSGMVAPEDAIEVWLTMAETQQFNLQNWESAAESLQKVLSQKPDHMDASERLESIYTDNEKWSDLAGLLDQRSQHLEDPEDQRELYLRLSELYEHRLEELSTALIYLQAAHRVSLGDVDVLRAIERVATATESWQELLDEMSAAIEVMEDELDQVDFGIRCARLLRDKLERSEEAIDWFRKVLDLEPEHHESLTELAQLLEQTQQWASLVDVLETRYDAGADSFEQTELGIKIGRVLYEEMGEVDRAVEAYQRILDSGEADQAALEALERIFTEHQRWESLIEILDAKASSGLGDETELRMQIGLIREGKLDDMEGAIEVYEDIVTYNETHRQALDRLLELYASVDDFEKLTGVYERLLHTAAEPADQISYCEALALLQEQVHENPEAAADYYHRVLQIDDHHGGALEALERLYAELDQWEDLIDVYRRRMEQASDDETWVLFKERSATVYAEALNDPDNAIYAWQELLDRAPTYRPALDSLDRLFRQTEQWEQVQDILEKKVSVAETVPERVTLMCDRAAIVLDDLADPDGAIDILNRALSEDPANDRALTLLEKVYVARVEWDNVIGVLERRDEHTATDEGRASVQVRIAEVYHDRLQEPERAIEYYEKALEFTPGAVDTADRLARLYIANEDWVKSEALLSMIVNRAPDDVADEWRVELHCNLGLALENLLRPQEALREYETAYELRADDLGVLRAIGRLASASGDFSRAEAIYTQMVERIDDEADDSELLELFRTLGQMAFQAGNIEKARTYLEKTIELQPDSRDALRSLIELCEGEKYWDGVIEYASELQILLDDPLESFDLQLRLGDIHLKHLDQLDEAVSSYQAALDYQPNSKAAHFKIFQVLVDAEKYDDAVEILERLVELEEDSKRKAQYLGAIGDIFREKTGEPERAVDYYERALDEDASLLKLFRAVDEVLTRNKDWKRLQKAYRNMLHRVQDDDSQVQLQHKLCFNLGEIYRTRLKQIPGAIAAFEAALDIKANDKKSLMILSELYEQTDALDKAIDSERRLLRIEPGNIDHYRHIKRMYFETNDKDAAWVSCSVLSLLGQANDREEAFYHDHAVQGMADGETPDGDIWIDYLLSRGEDPLIGQIFNTVLQGLGDMLVTTTLKDLGVKKKNAVDMQERELFTHTFNECVRTLGVQPPAIYYSSKVQGTIIGQSLPPVMLIGDQMRKGQTDQGLAFVLAKVLTYFHPLHMAVGVLPIETLEIIFAASLKLFVPEYDVGALAKDPNFLELLEALNGMAPQLRQSLQRYVGEFVAKGRRPNLRRWLNQIELSANHAGLLMCGDVVVAGKLIKSESHRTLFTAPGRLSTRDKLVDLATFAMSEQYLTLRNKLELTIE
jgi:tetratricopeptide (TPR) repeat protein